MEQLKNIQRDFLGRWIEVQSDGGYYDDFELRLLKRKSVGILPLEPPLIEQPAHYRFHTDCCRPLSDWLVSDIAVMEMLPAILKDIVGTYFQLCQYMLCSERICLEPSLIFIDASYGVHLLYLPEGGQTTVSVYQNPRLDTKQRFLVLFKALTQYIQVINEGLMTPEQLYDKYAEPYTSERRNRQSQSADIVTQTEISSLEMSRPQDARDGERGFPGLDCLKTRKSFIRIALGIFLYELLCIAMFMLGLICLRQITGDLSEARLGWGLISLGLNLLGLRFLLPWLHKDSRAQIRVTKTTDTVQKLASKATESQGLETELLESAPRLSDSIMHGIKHSAKYSFASHTEVAYRFEGAQALVGRNKQLVQWCLEDPAVGRQHARLELIEGQLYLSDLDSRNGTFVNSEDIRGCGAVLLTVGDVITFAGGVAFVMMNEEGG